MDLALNNLQRLICHKTNETKPNPKKKKKKKKKKSRVVQGLIAIIGILNLIEV